MNGKHVFNIVFVISNLCGLIYFYYTGINGHVGRTQVLYAVTDEALPLYIIENICLIWFPFSVLFAHCVEEIWLSLYKNNRTVIHSPGTKILLSNIFLIYASIIAIKILQLHYYGEYLITEQGELQFYPPCSLKDALLYVVHLSRIGRHLCWILDSFALSYLLSKWFGNGNLTIYQMHKRI